jgi:hypothetical protein
MNARKEFYLINLRALDRGYRIIGLLFEQEEKTVNACLL